MARKSRRAARASRALIPRASRRLLPGRLLLSALLLLLSACTSNTHFLSGRELPGAEKARRVHGFAVSLPLRASSADTAFKRRFHSLPLNPWVYTVEKTGQGEGGSGNYGYQYVFPTTGSAFLSVPVFGSGAESRFHQSLGGRASVEMISIAFILWMNRDSTEEDPGRVEPQAEKEDELRIPYFETGLFYDASLAFSPAFAFALRPTVDLRYYAGWSVFSGVKAMTLLGRKSGALLEAGIRYNHQGKNMELNAGIGFFFPHRP